MKTQEEPQYAIKKTVKKAKQESSAKKKIENHLRITAKSKEKTSNLRLINCVRSVLVLSGTGEAFQINNINSVTVVTTYPYHK